MLCDWIARRSGAKFERVIKRRRRQLLSSASLNLVGSSAAGLAAALPRSPSTGAKIMLSARNPLSARNEQQQPVSRLSPLKNLALNEKENTVSQRSRQKLPLSTLDGSSQAGACLLGTRSGGRDPSRSLSGEQLQKPRVVPLRPFGSAVLAVRLGQIKGGEEGPHLFP